MDSRRLADSLVSGLAAASAVTAVHQSLKPRVTGAPRMDVYGRRAIARSMRGAGVEPPKGNRLQTAALVGDIVANTLYYALVGFVRAKRAGRTGGGLGLLAGLGAVLLPPVLGLGSKPGARRKNTIALTIAYYTLGGVVSAVVYRALRGRR